MINGFIHLLWCIMWIGGIVLVPTCYIGLYRQIRKLRSALRTGELPNITAGRKFFWTCRTASMALLIVTGLLLIQSPNFFEAIDEHGYAVFKQDGTYGGFIEDTHAIVLQKDWDAATKDKVIMHPDNVRLSRNYDGRLELYVPFNGEREGTPFHVTCTGDDGRTNIINRLALLFVLEKKDGRRSPDPYRNVVSSAITSSPMFEKIEQALKSAQKENRELSIDEKADLYRDIAPYEAEIWAKYAIRIIDIAVR